jgi:hypothetical protein
MILNRAILKYARTITKHGRAYLAPQEALAALQLVLQWVHNLSVTGVNPSH